MYICTCAGEPSVGELLAKLSEMHDKGRLGEVREHQPHGQVVVERRVRALNLHIQAKRRAVVQLIEVLELCNKLQPLEHDLYSIDGSQRIRNKKKDYTAPPNS